MSRLTSSPDIEPIRDVPPLPRPRQRPRKPATMPGPRLRCTAVNDNGSGCTPARGLTFGRYELLMELGKGGMATLYLARLHGPRKFEKLLALKKIHDHLCDEREFVDMFLDEARIAVRIHHPNVVTVFDLGKTESVFYIAMDYVHGQTLRDVLRLAFKTPDHLPWTHAARIVADAADGLHAAHTLTTASGRPLNVVHRDVSPQNILISYDGHVKVADFGIAYAAEKLNNTDVGTLKGKAAYMSPEQTEAKQLDRRSDIFSLGILLYESATFTRLFDAGSDVATLLNVRKGRIPRPRSVNPRIPERLDEIITKALSRDPAQRFATAREMANALNDLLVAHGERIGSHKLGSMMHALFKDQRAAKEEAIAAAQQEVPEILEGVAIEEPASKATGPVPGLEGRARGLRMFLYALGAGFFLFLGVLAMVWFGAKPDRTRARTSKGATPMTAAPSDGRRAPETAAKVVVTVHILPKSAPAKLEFRGVAHTGPDIILVLPRSREPEIARIIAPGYRPAEVVVRPERDQRFTIELSALPRKARRRVWRKPRRFRRKKSGKKKARRVGRLVDPF